MECICILSDAFIQKVSLTHKCLSLSFIESYKEHITKYLRLPNALKEPISPDTMKHPNN